MNSRRSSWLSLAAIAFAIIGLGASIASLVDTLADAPTFCAESGCATVRDSAWAHPLGIPLPAIGIAFFLAAIALAFVDAPRLRRALAIAGAAVAVLLIGVQAFAIGAWCKLCLVADPAALGYAVAVLAGATTLRFTVARGLAAAPALLATVGVLALWSEAAPPAHHLPPGTPAFVERAQVPGVTTIVEVVDFECPACRAMHPRLTAAIAKAGKPVRIVRKMLPLDFHPHAMAAALAYCCAEAQGKGDAMADALFAARPEELTPEGCEKLAARIGCDLERYRRDLPQAKARVAAEMAEMQTAGIRRLPTTFIGGERIEGAGSTGALVAMIERATSAARR